MVRSKNVALKIIGIIGVFLYISFLVGEKVPLFKSTSFTDLSVYLLFLFFLVGIICMWRNLIVAGIVFIIWYALQWMLVLWVWINGAMTLIFGFPIAIFGIVVLVFGITQKRKIRNFKKSNFNHLVR